MASHQQKGPKLFSVQEANQLLPEVQEILKDLRKRRSAVLKLDEKKAVEELSWLREDGSVSPKAKSEVDRLDKRMEEEAGAFEEGLERLGEIGAQLKDLDEGLVDFFTARGETLVCLCWKEGEDRIRHWHDLESGFTGRRPLEQL